MIEMQRGIYETEAQSGLLIHISQKFTQNADSYATGVPTTIIRTSIPVGSETITEEHLLGHHDGLVLVRNASLIFMCGWIFDLRKYLCQQISTAMRSIDIRSAAKDGDALADVCIAFSTVGYDANSTRQEHKIMLKGLPAQSIEEARQKAISTVRMHLDAAAADYNPRAQIALGHQEVIAAFGSERWLQSAKAALKG